MRILLHDFGGYAFIIPLARWLALQGHEVLHLCADGLVGPRGETIRLEGDPPGLQFAGLASGRPFSRYALHRRLIDEIRYGRALVQAVAASAPDIVLSANTPPLAQAIAVAGVQARGIPFVAWVQDIFSLGAAPMLGRLPWPLAGMALGLLRRVEFGTLARTDGLVAIAPSFLDSLAAQGVHHPLTLVRENWAANPAGTRPERCNAWARGHGLEGRRVLLAAGTLGKKHDPDLLADLATALTAENGVRVVVVSQGPGRDHLERRMARDGLDNLLLLDYQPAARVPEMLASADIGIVQLNAAAAGMSVPSKFYSYAAAGLPILAAVPGDNHVAHLIRTHGIGLAVEPDDKTGLIAAARRLLNDSDLRAACSAAGLAFTARHGDIAAIGQEFVAFLDRVRQAGFGQSPGSSGHSGEKR